jgi:hypothetical protein
MLDDYHLCRDCPLEAGSSVGEGSAGEDGRAGVAEGGADGPRQAHDGSGNTDGHTGGDSGDGGLVVDASDDGADAGDGSSTTDASDAGTLDLGLLAYYRFDETGGTTAADGSGNGYTASLAGGATFSAGVRGHAVTLSGASQYVSLPSGILGSATAFSVAAWVKLSAAQTWGRIFDFGTGTTVYMFLTPNSSASTTRFAMTASGNQQEQQVNTTPTLPTGTWQHVAITLSGSTAILYVEGAPVAQNTTMTLSPASLGSTTQNWIGRSQYAADPYLNGQVDNFRIYDRALSAAEVQALYASQL